MAGLLAKGEIDQTPNLQRLRSAGGIVLLDADRAPAPSPVAMCRAMDEAIEHAKSVHAGCCVANSIIHAGAVGHFALKAATAGMIGVVMTTSVPLMADHGGKRPVVLTNPIAPALTGRTGTNMNGVAIALDIAAIGDRSEFPDDVDALGQAIAVQPTAPGTQRLLLAGERGDAMRAERERAGIPLPAGTWSGSAAVAAERGIAMPNIFA